MVKFMHRSLFLSSCYSPRDSIDPQYSENRDDGHPVVIGADEEILSVVPAERKEEL